MVSQNAGEAAIRTFDDLSKQIVQAVTALQQKDASRAEELFGVNTVITRNDFIQARES